MILAKPKRRLPCVLTVEEVSRVLGELNGVPSLGCRGPVCSRKGPSRPAAPVVLTINQSDELRGLPGSTTSSACCSPAYPERFPTSD